MNSNIKRNDPEIGYFMREEIHRILDWCRLQCDVATNSEQLDKVQKIPSVISEYQAGAITFNEMFDLCCKYGYTGEKLNLISSKGVDYGEIATFDEICSITDEDLKPFTLGYKFNGEPAHPELFNFNIEEGDRFSGKPEVKQGTFIYQCPKIGGQKFQFTFDTNEYDDDGDFWIEFTGDKLAEINRALGSNDLRFELRIIDDENRYQLRSDGVLLSSLIKLGEKDFKYEIAFADGKIEDGTFVEFSQKELNSEEVEIFKSYIRAFVEALEGEGLYTTELERVSSIAPTKKNGCMGMVIIPLIMAIGAVIGFFI